ncbi:hypothetical protein BDD12DRAFT_885184 [Trichophaea hybrida]|nr:hypothetical protein BDD12DRAFT_885184 [Trichophaea hybrida]
MSGVTPSNPLLATHLFSVPSFKAAVTGRATGIGLMITQDLATNGATIIPITPDLSSTSSIKELAAQIAEKEPQGIHLLVNNAGVAKEKEPTSFSTGNVDFNNAESITTHLGKGTPESWAETFQTNVTAQYFTFVEFISMLAAGTKNTPGYSASIVNIASISGIMKGSSSGQFTYAASKAAFLQLTQNLATTLKGVEVRVNCIAPGVFPSEMTAGESDEANKSSLEGKGKGLPAGRSGSEEDMAAAILYLAGKGGVFLNGQVLYSDRGNLLTTP